MSDALDLIATAEALLRDAVAPGGADARYHVLLAANALAMARRELSSPPPAPDHADPAAIRAGRHDGDRALHDRLLRDARRRAWIADPDAVDRD